ncbi:MAG: hypothetical protein BHV69_08955 [Bacteroidales bacterium 52_46]|nr:MAG: hypothetical protein BHV69_08955 [Bacteroidales bacterium 52_46]
MSRAPAKATAITVTICDIHQRKERPGPQTRFVVFQLPVVTAAVVDIKTVIIGEIRHDRTCVVCRTELVGLFKQLPASLMFPIGLFCTCVKAGHGNGRKHKRGVKLFHWIFWL